MGGQLDWGEVFSPADREKYGDEFWIPTSMTSLYAHDNHNQIFAENGLLMLDKKKGTVRVRESHGHLCTLRASTVQQMRTHVKSLFAGALVRPELEQNIQE